jgi:hypothetical protein
MKNGNYPSIDQILETCDSIMETCDSVMGESKMQGLFNLLVDALHLGTLPGDELPQRLGVDPQDGAVDMYEADGYLIVPLDRDTALQLRLARYDKNFGPDAA